MEQTVERKSFLFAVRIVKLCKHLNAAKKEFVLSKQLLRAGTSIGANIAEAEQLSTEYADVVELVDSLDLGSNARACRFESCHPHQ